MENQTTQTGGAFNKKSRLPSLYIRAFVLFAVTAAVILALTFAAKSMLSGIKPAYERQGVPSYVDVQLIKKDGHARTGEALTDVKYIVIHYVGNPGTSAQNNRNYFNNKETKVSAHFVVGLEGEIILCVPITEKAQASNERNADSISVEVCHEDESGKFNEATYASLVKLTAWLCERFDLDVGTSVIRHYDVTGKLCPLYYVEHEDEWLRFKDEVAIGGR